MIGSGLQMNDRIKNTDELEFVIFCIENLAIRLKTNAEHIYTALAESNSFLYDYIVAHYDVLHTQIRNTSSMIYLRRWINAG